MIVRLIEGWQEEYDRWQRRDLSARRYAYIWADGIYLQARMDPEAECILIIIGATPEGPFGATRPAGASAPACWVAGVAFATPTLGDRLKMLSEHLSALSGNLDMRSALQVALAVSAVRPVPENFSGTT